MKSMLAALLLVTSAGPFPPPTQAALDCGMFEPVKPGKVTLYLTDCATVLKNFKTPVVIDKAKKTLSYPGRFSDTLAGVCYQGSYLAKLRGKPVTVLLGGVWTGAVKNDRAGPYQTVFTQQLLSGGGSADGRLYAADRIYFTQGYEAETVLGGSGEFQSVDGGSSGGRFAYVPSAAKQGELPLSVTATRTQGKFCFAE